MSELTNHELNILIQMSKMRLNIHKDEYMRRNFDSRYIENSITIYESIIEKLERMKSE